MTKTYLIKVIPYNTLLTIKRIVMGKDDLIKNAIVEANLDISNLFASFTEQERGSKPDLDNCGSCNQGCEAGCGDGCKSGQK